MAKEKRGIRHVKPSRLLRGQSRHVQGIASDPDHIRLEGGEMVARVGGAVVEPGVTLERSIEGASVLNVPIHDPRGELRGTNLLTRNYEVELDGLYFVFVGYSRDAAGLLTLVHEDREVYRLRQRTGPEKVFRDKWTRAEFLASLVAEVKRPERIPFYSPELHAVQPIATDRDAREREADVNPTRGKGVDTTANLTVKGQKADGEQIRVIETVLRVGDSLQAPSAALIAGVITVIQEAVARNPSGGDGTSSGAFQVLASTAATYNVDPRDVAECAHHFFTKGWTGAGGAIQLAKRGMSPASIAGAVQGNANGASDYVPWLDEGREWVSAFKGGEITGGAALDVEVTKRYSFERKRNESTWSCGKRLGDEVNWRWFCSNGVVYYVAETDLLASKVRGRVKDGEDGVLSISYSYDVGRPVTEVSVAVRGNPWVAPPGTVVTLADEGPASGRYIVSKITSNLHTHALDVTLKRPTKPLPEPAPETKTVSVGAGASAGSGGAGAAGLEGVRIKSFAAGAPAWGGTRYIFDQFVHPFMKQRGLSPGSQKRPYNTGSGISDHYVGSTLAYATDYGTGDGAKAANELGRAMGRGGGSVGTYDRFNISVSGKTFSVQILWAVPDHYDHVHVGINR